MFIETKMYVYLCVYTYVYSSQGWDIFFRDELQSSLAKAEGVQKAFKGPGTFLAAGGQTWDRLSFSGYRHATDTVFGANSRYVRSQGVLSYRRTLGLSELTERVQSSQGVLRCGSHPSGGYNKTCILAPVPNYPRHPERRRMES